VADLLARLSALVPQEGGPPLLRLLCPDATPAEAAIRLAAAATGWTVHRVLGLGSAATAPDALTLDGSADNPQAAAAAASGIIGRNCDVLIALGDARAEPLAGQIGLAAGLGVPVMWLPPAAPARLLLGRGWHLARDSLPEGEAAWEALRRSTLAMLIPPVPEAGAFPPPAVLPDWWFWQAHRATMAFLWCSPKAGEPPEPPPPGEWRELYTAADALAGRYADRYRSSYVLVLALAAAALVAAVLGLGLRAVGLGGHPLWTAVPELGFLIGIVAIVAANQRYDWRSRMILCRLLAEFCRKQAALSYLARSLPTSHVTQLTQGGELGVMAWRFAAAVRAAPLAQGVLAGPRRGGGGKSGWCGRAGWRSS
jgi:hypothetical protein